MEIGNIDKITSSKTFRKWQKRATENIEIAVPRELDSYIVIRWFDS